MQRWADTMNNLTSDERALVFSIIHAPSFSQSDKAESRYSENVNNALRFYANLRNDVQNSGGMLFELKQEFDALPKEDIEYIKNISIPILKR